MGLLISVLSGFALAAAAPLLCRVLGRRAGYAFSLLPLGLAVYFSTYVNQVSDRAVTASFDWLPSLGLSLSFYLDGLSLFFALLISAVGAVVVIYSAGYLSKHVGSFHAYMLAFMASMLGLVLAGNLLALYVFWELTTITSFLLIGFEHESKSARSAAIQALLVTALGGLALLAGVVLLGQVAGSYEIAALLEGGKDVREHRLYLPILSLLLLGAFTKSAQFPFHFWLPAAMEAPAPVSAYLHSATMVKAGVYLLARLEPVLAGTGEWTTALLTVGAVTMLAGGLLAYFEHDLKGILAYLTINVLGTLIMLLGIGTKLSRKAALVYLLAHALYKGALFLVAGAVDHQTGERDIRAMGGLRRRMPISTTLAIVSALSMLGMFPMLGFVAKEVYLEAAWKAPDAHYWLTLASVVASSLLAAAALLIGIKPFFGSTKPNTEKVQEANFALWIAPAVLTFGSLAVGLFPEAAASPLIEPAMAAMAQESTSIELKHWHGVTVPFVLSLAAILSGVGLYLLRARIVDGLASDGVLSRFSLQHLYTVGGAGFKTLAAWQTSFLQRGYLRLYLLAVVATVVLLAGLRLLQTAELPDAFPGREIRLHEGAAALLIVATTLVCVWSTSRLLTVAAVTAAGFGLAWVFSIFGAPDLAMTQLVVESLSTLLLVLVLSRLPEFTVGSSRGARLRDALLAAAAGVLVAGLLLAATFTHPPRVVSEFYAEKSLPEAHGRNIVNVILVDFRAFDTLGEITVFAAAAAGAFSLLKRRPEEDA